MDVEGVADVDTSVLIGYSAGEYIGQGNTNASRVICVGFRRGKYATGSYNTFIGYTSGRGGTTSVPYNSGIYNTSLVMKLFIVTQQELVMYCRWKSCRLLYWLGDRNTFLGISAGYSTTTGYNQVFIGASAGQNAVSGNENVFIGYQSGLYQKSGGNNVAVGTGGLYGVISDPNGTSTDCVAIGFQAARGNAAGTGITAVGRGAMRNSHMSASYSTFVGYNSGYYATGSHNTFVGAQAGQGTTSLPYASGEYNTGVGRLVMNVSNWYKDIVSV